MTDESTTKPTLKSFLWAFPWELLCVVACASWFLLANFLLSEKESITSIDSYVWTEQRTSWGWPVPWQVVETSDYWLLLPEDRVHSTTNWSVLLLNAAFTIAVTVLGVLTIRFLRRRRFTLATRTVFVFYLCIAIGALRAALDLCRTEQL